MHRLTKSLLLGCGLTQAIGDWSYYAQQFDIDSIQKSITQDIMQELENEKISTKIQKEIDKKAMEIVKKQQEIGKEWEKFYATERKLWDSFNQMTVKQKLANILDDLDNDDKLDELWKKLEKTDDMKKITVDFDVDSGKIGVSSKKKDANGLPILDWLLDTKTGDIVQTTRNATTGSERVVEKTIDVKTLKNPDAVPQAVLDVTNKASTKKASGSKKDTTSSTTTTSTTTSDDATTDDDTTETDAASKGAGAITANWDDMEMQRDVAFKIIYFFILFIAATFGLLYAYFNLSKKERIEQDRKARAKGIFFGEPTQQTFFDFLSGQNDPESNQFRSDSQIIRGTMEKKSQNMNSTAGFGASHNLENLVEYQRPNVYNN